jgi:hypothetical protein
VTTPAAALDRPGEARVYPIPIEGTGEIIEHPSITDIISVLDPAHICDWKQKMAILGASQREDLWVKIAAANLLPAGPPRNTELRRLLAECITAGQIIEKGHLAADRGTGYHSLTERLDDLVPPGAVRMVDELGLPRSAADIARAYVDAMAPVEILHTEVTVCSVVHGYAGTGDRIIRFRPLNIWTELFDQYDLSRGCFIFDAKFGTVHDTVAMQLAAIANADPTDPRNIVVANDDPRVLDLKRRLEMLPPDLAAGVRAENARAKACPNLNTGRVTVAHLAALEPIVAAAEAEAMPRAKRITEAFELAEAYGISEAALCALLGVAEVKAICAEALTLLDIVADAICLPDRILVERDGVIVVDQPAAVLAAYDDSRSALLKAGRTAALAHGIESPKDSDAVLAHPILTAAVAVV